jgi:hypothetical protein
MDKIDLETLIAIATDVEQADPIDFGRLSMGKQEAFRLVGTSILEMFDKDEYTFDDKLILLSTVTKLTVENMLLHIKLLSLKEGIE